MDIVEHDRERAVRRRLLERLADGPRDVLRRCVRVRLPHERPDSGRHRLVGRADRELSQDLDYRPIADALSVRQAPAAQDRYVELREGLGDETRLADACIRYNRDELATTLSESGLPHLSQKPELSGATD